MGEIVVLWWVMGSFVVLRENMMVKIVIYFSSDLSVVF